MASRMLKRMAARLPTAMLQELERLHFGRQIRKSKFYTSEPEYALLNRWVSLGDWVVDVGANVGHYTLEMSRLVGATGRVVAFEPVPRTASLLLANVLAADARNVSVINAALSSNTSVSSMAWPKGAGGVNNYYEAQLAPESQLPPDARVLTVTLDSFRFPNRISLVKIDVEGHELDALKGMRSVLTSDKPILVVEGIASDVASFLSDFGYDSQYIKGSPNSIFSPVAAVRTTAAGRR